MKKFLKEILIKFILIILLISVFAIDFGIQGYSCYSKASKQELEWSYGPIQGCMVKSAETNNKWIDYDKYRIFDEKIR